MKEATLQERDNPCGPEEQQLLAVGSEQNAGVSVLKVLLVGKQGAGKSTAGNSLLGKRVFETKFSHHSVTTKFQSESRIWRERKILIIDSPDLSSSKYWKSDLWQHTPKGPHAFLLVTPLGSFNEEDKKVLSNIQSNFGDKVTKYMVILLTRKEDLGGQRVDSVLTHNADLHELIKKCENRCSIFKYRGTEEEERSQVDEVLETLVHLVQENGDRPCHFGKEEALTIILVGRSGTGKSATGNTILGRSDFVSRLQAQPVTKTCQESKTTVAEQNLIVVDTPAPSLMFHDPSQLETVRGYLSRGNRNTILVLVLQLGRVVREDGEAVKMLESKLGNDVTKHMIVLFTHKEDLGVWDLSEYYGNPYNMVLTGIIEKCGNRQVCAFNNKEIGQAREDQVAELLKMANELIASMKGMATPVQGRTITEKLKIVWESKISRSSK